MQAVNDPLSTSVPQNVVIDRFFYQLLVLVSFPTYGRGTGNIELLMDKTFCGDRMNLDSVQQLTQTCRLLGAKAGTQSAR